RAIGVRPGPGRLRPSGVTTRPAITQYVIRDWVHGASRGRTAGGGFDPPKAHDNAKDTTCSKARGRTDASVVNLSEAKPGRTRTALRPDRARYFSGPPGVALEQLTGSLVHDAPDADHGPGLARRVRHLMPWPLLAICVVQSALSVRLAVSSTAFQDVALYLWAGHLEWSHWLTGAPIPAFNTYFS